MLFTHYKTKSVHFLGPMNSATTDLYVAAWDPMLTPSWRYPLLFCYGSISGRIPDTPKASAVRGGGETERGEVEGP